MAVLSFCLLAAFPAPASADVETIDFDGADAANPPLNAPLETAGRVSFLKELGLRPYRAEFGGAKTGAFVGDVRHCFDEALARGEAPGNACEQFHARTGAVLGQTAETVTVFAGQFDGSFPEQAKLTAFDAEGTEVAHAGPLPISTTFNRELTVTRAAKDIAIFTVEARTGPAGEEEAGADLGIDDVSVNFAAGGQPDFVLSTTNQVLPLVQGQSAELPVHLSRLNGSSGKVELSVENLPAGVSAPPVLVEGSQSTTATLTLSASPTTPDTHFVPTQAKVVARPIDVNSGKSSRASPLLIRVATDFELSAGGVSDTENRPLRVEVPDCAPVDVPIGIGRDIAMNRDVSLSPRDGEGAGQALPPGVSADLLPDSVVAPGGNLLAQRTLRLRAGPSSLLGRNSLSLLLEGNAPGSSPHLLEIDLVHATGGATIATAAPGSGNGLTPRFGREGSPVRIHGQGFCSGTEVRVGNDGQAVPAKLVDDRTIEFRVPRYATTGRVTILPTGNLPSYKTEERLLVDSVRNAAGFPFENYPFQGLGIDELTKAFGEDELFIRVNPCWPFGDCGVSTGFLNPLAALDWGWMNAFLRGTGGHCFGINLAVQRLESGSEPRRRYADPGTAGDPGSAFEMSTPQGPGDALGSLLDALHARQYSDEFLTARLDRDRSMQRQLDLLEREFAHGREPMIVLEHGFSSASHAVLAYDMARKPDRVEIYVYDNEHPFTEAEDLYASEHVARVDRGVITVFRATDTWRFPVFTAKEEYWTGSGANGSFWTVPHEAVPDDPSLPGLLSTGKAALASLGIGSSDGSVRGRRASAGAVFLPASEDPAAPSGNGTWVADARHPLDVHLEGVRSGRYAEAYTAPGFVATLDGVATAQGVRDTISGGADSVTLDSGRARPLRIALAHRASGGASTSATLDTHASARGSDTAGLSGEGVLRYAHDGAPTAVELSLTTVRRDGGPSTFVSGPIAVGRGARLRAVPLRRDLSRVRVVVRAAGGRTTTRVLRSRKRAGGRLRLGAPRVSKHLLGVRVKLSGLGGRAVLGAVLRLRRGAHVVLRKAVAVKTRAGTRRIFWALPRNARRGRYRARIDVRAVGLGGPGAPSTASVVAHRGLERGPRLIGRRPLRPNAPGRFRSSPRPTHGLGPMWWDAALAYRRWR